MKESAEILIEESHKTNKAAFWRNIAFIVGISVLAFMVYKVGVESIVSNIRNVGWWFVPIIGTWGVVYIANAISWYRIIDDGSLHGLSFARVWKFTVSGFALNYITPMGLAGGEPYRIMELKPYLGTEKSTAYVILYLMMHICSHYLFWITSIALVALTVPMSHTLMAILIAVFLVFVILIYLFFKGYRKGLVITILRKLSHLPWIGSRIRLFSERHSERLLLVDQEIAALHGERKVAFYISLFMEYVARLINCFEIYLIAMSLESHITYSQALIVSAMSSLLANILFFSPLQLGTREGGFLLAYKLLGLAPGLSIAVSLITRIREFFWIMVGLFLMKVGNRN